MIRTTKGLFVPVVTVVLATLGLFFFGFERFQVEAAGNGEVSSPSKWTAIDCLRNTIRNMEALPSVSAEIQLRMFLFDETYTGIGKYEELSFRNEKVAQSRPGGSYVEKRSPLEWNAFRLHIKMLSTSARALVPGASENFLEVVCDRQALWTYTSIEGKSTLTQINIEDLSNSLSKLSSKESKILQQQGVEHACGMSGLPGAGGLSGLMKSINANYEFDPKIEKMQFRGGNYPVWKLCGKMKKDRRERIKERLLWCRQDLSPDYFDFLPTDVELYIGCNTHFPCQIIYSCTIEGGKEEKRTLMEMDFVRIILADSTLRQENFIYGTPRKNYDRINEDYLRLLIPDIEL